MSMSLNSHRLRRLFLRVAPLVVISGVAFSAAEPTIARAQDAATDLATATQLANEIEHWNKIPISRRHLPPNYCEHRKQARALIRNLREDDAYNYRNSSLSKAMDRLADAEADEHESWWYYDDNGDYDIDDPCDDWFFVGYPGDRLGQPIPHLSWSGAYVGANGSLATGWSRWDFPDGSTGRFPVTGGFVGATLGYNEQTGSWVYGGEATFHWGSLTGSSTNNCGVGCRTTGNWVDTFDARAGYIVNDNSFLYLKAGAAVGDIKQSFNNFPGGGSETRVGWNVGIGAEIALDKYWSVKAEYLHIDLGNASCGVPCGSPTVPLREDLFMVGLNRHFRLF
jgi:outer membrane immunogenic protein